MRTLPFPPGVYSVLPILNESDNFTLPTGPWNLEACKQRVQRHARAHSRHAQLSSKVEESAVDDDDDDESDETHLTSFDDEFLVPFFVSVPPPVHPTSAPPLARSNSRPSSRAPSFSRMTPLPSLRSSSPTPSYPTPLPSASTARDTIEPQPIGFLRPSVLKALAMDNAKMISMSCKPVWAFYPPLQLPAPPPKPISRRNSSFSSRSRRGSLGVTPLTTPGTPTEAKIDGGSSSTQLRDVLEGLKLAAASENGHGGHGSSGISGTYAVGFEDWVNEDGADARKEHMDRLCRGWKMAGMFPDMLGGWRNEHYAIYGPVPPYSASSPSKADTGVGGDEEQEQESSPLPGSNIVFEMERAACALFGLATFGVHLTGYVEEPGQPLKLWVPRRSATKQTWPSYLDNTVAGGITARASPYESIVRECAEEASLPESWVEENIKAVSALSYTYRTKTGWVQPEVQYLYDLKFPSPSEGGIVPKTNAADGEVESFELMELEEVVKRMCDGEFKPNCSLVLMDFFIRHGYLTPESDVRFLEVATRLRRGLVLPGPA